jgi:hypothetical protein
MVEEARLKVITEIIGRYIPTARNGLVRDHFEKLGFVQIDSSSEETTWRLAVSFRRGLRIPDRHRKVVAVEKIDEPVLRGELGRDR